jgi:hypothetical protein
MGVTPEESSDLHYFKKIDKAAFIQEYRLINS